MKNTEPPSAKSPCCNAPIEETIEWDGTWKWCKKCYRKFRLASAGAGIESSTQGWRVPDNLQAKKARPVSAVQSSVGKDVPKDEVEKLLEEIDALHDSSIWFPWKDVTGSQSFAISEGGNLAKSLGQKHNSWPTIRDYVRSLQSRLSAAEELLKRVSLRSTVGEREKLKEDAQSFLDSI